MFLVDMASRQSARCGTAHATLLLENAMSDTDRPLRSPFASFLPGKLWPDNMGVHINAHGGGLLFHEGVYYWYGEHKIAGEAGNRAHVGVHVYASTDLYNWRDEGVALAVSDDPESPITKECVLERPKVIHNVRTATFVMWFHLELKGQGYNAALAAVAVSDSPTGPFRFVAAFRPNAGQWPANVPEEMRSVPEPDRVQETSSEAPNPEARQQNILGRDLEGGQMSRDQTLFVDDDGSAYHLTASEENSTLHISRLTDDYLAPSGTTFACSNAVGWKPLLSASVRGRTTLSAAVARAGPQTRRVLPSPTVHSARGRSLRTPASGSILAMAWARKRPSGRKAPTS